MPIAIQAAPPSSDTPSNTVPGATSAKKDNKFAALLDQARQATPGAGTSPARASYESPTQKETRGKQSHGKDRQDDSTSRGPDSPALELAAAVPVPELSPLLPTSTQVCAANVATVKESGNTVRSFPTAGVKTPNTAVAGTVKQTVAPVAEPPAPEQGHPADLFAATGSCPPTQEGAGAQPANPTASPQIEPTALPPDDHDAVLPQPFISTRQAERAATAQTQGDFVREVAKSPEPIAAPGQDRPRVAPPRDVANPTPPTDRTATAKLKVQERQAASSASPSDPVNASTEKPGNVPLLGQDVDTRAPRPTPVMATHEAPDPGVTKIQAVSISVAVPPAHPEKLGATQ